MTEAALPLTYFADPERTPREKLERQHRTLAANPVVSAFLAGFPESAAVLNAQREIVLANERLVDLAKAPLASLVGQRIGEAVGCEYSHEPPAGCGTTPACELCGAAQAMVQAQATRQPARRECRIVLRPDHGHDSLEFGVWTTPLDVEGEPYTVFAIKDTSSEQRRRILERLFFHDVLNSAGGLQNLLQLMPDMPSGEIPDLALCASHLAGQVVEEIESQRDLAAAERGELTPRPSCVDVPRLVEDLRQLYQHHSSAHGKSLALVMLPPSHGLTTDPVLLRRVLGNLLKNALEASRAGETVTLRYHHNGRPTFEVHNHGVMPEVVKLQVFRRSFSTKEGVGRGIGAYSARLLTERYLGGELRFTSEDSGGTTFTVTLPAAR